MRSLLGKGFRQRGVVVIFTAFLLAVLLGFLALAIDLGRMFVVKTEVQSAMDSCALAAATQLRPGLNDSGALTRAQNYGLAMVDEGKTSANGARPRGSVNRANFQKSAISRNDVQVGFAEFINATIWEPAGTANPNTAKFVRCSYALANLPIFFARFVGGVTSASVPAYAVATLASAQTVCGFPIAACKVPGTSATYTNPAGELCPYGLCEGSWLTSTNSGSYGTGNFGWIDYTPPQGGANELKDIIRGEGVCNLQRDVRVGQTGVAASLRNAWNTRFGIYDPSSSQTATDSQPDRTGFAYTTTSWPAAVTNPTKPNAFPDYYDVKRPDAVEYQGDTLSGMNLPGNLRHLTHDQHATLGRLRRLVIVPIVDCTVWNVPPGSANPTVEDFACILLLRPLTNPGQGSFTTQIEFVGLASKPNSPCGTTGLGGGTAGPLAPVLVR